MKLLFFGYIIIANLQFYDANQIEFGEWYNSFLELSKNMTEVMNRLNKIEKDNVELKQDNLVLKRENIELKNETAQLKNQVQTLESDMDIILRKNGKGNIITYKGSSNRTNSSSAIDSKTNFLSVPRLSQLLPIF